MKTKRRKEILGALVQRELFSNDVFRWQEIDVEGGGGGHYEHIDDGQGEVPEIRLSSVSSFGKKSASDPLKRSEWCAMACKHLQAIWPEGGTEDELL